MEKMGVVVSCCCISFVKVTFVGSTIKRGSNTTCKIDDHESNCKRRFRQKKCLGTIKHYLNKSLSYSRLNHLAAFVPVEVTRMAMDFVRQRGPIVT